MKWLGEIATADLMTVFHHEGKAYGHVHRFTKHQAISTNERKGGPKYPSPTIATKKHLSESTPEASAQTLESKPVAGVEDVIPRSDDGQTNVVPRSALHRTEDVGHRTEDTGRSDPPGPDIFDPVVPEASSLPDEERWPYESMQAWAKRLKPVVGTHLAKTNWGAWQRLLDAEHWTLEQVIDAADRLPALQRWPDNVETALDEIPRRTAVIHAPTLTTHQIAERIVHRDGWEACRARIPEWAQARVHDEQTMLLAVECGDGVAAHLVAASKASA